MKRAGLIESLEKLRFNLVGYGCTTCIGNSGPVDEAMAGAIKNGNLVACAILSGNRNFEGRINPVVRFNYLASPPLVVAYAIAGTMDIDVEHQPLGTGSDGRPVFLRDIWPSQDEVAAAVTGSVHAAMFKSEYGQVFEGDERWKSLKVPEGNLFRWAEDSLYVKAPPFFEGVTAKVGEFADIHGRACAGGSRRQRDDRSYFAGGLDRAGQSGGQVPDRARRAAQGFQLLRRAARES